MPNHQFNIHVIKEMKYKSLFYNVESIAKRLPDDCLKIVISYAYDDSAYNAIHKFLTHHKTISVCLYSIYNVVLFDSNGRIMYDIRKSKYYDTINHFRPSKPPIRFEITFELQTNKSILKLISFENACQKNNSKWYFDFNNNFRFV